MDSELLIRLLIFAVFAIPAVALCVGLIARVQYRTRDFLLGIAFYVLLSGAIWFGFIPADTAVLGIALVGGLLLASSYLLDIVFGHKKNGKIGGS